jgi:hypothetical protein
MKEDKDSYESLYESLRLPEVLLASFTQTFDSHSATMHSRIREVPVTRFLGVEAKSLELWLLVEMHCCLVPQPPPPLTRVV